MLDRSYYTVKLTVWHTGVTVTACSQSCFLIDINDLLIVNFCLVKKTF